MAHNSEVEGTAIAEALFGEIDPGGRLVTTWPSSLSQVPQMMDCNIRDGRTYMYSKEVPLFPFGFGLSYTTFQYSKLTTDANVLTAGHELSVTFDVKNTGTRVGDEVVQMYVTHLTSKVVRPQKELKGFERITLQPGEIKTLHLPLSAQALAYWDVSVNRWVVEKARVEIVISGSSATRNLAKTVDVNP